jgi:hypothetical protein
MSVRLVFGMMRLRLRIIILVIVVLGGGLGCRRTRFKGIFGIVISRRGIKQAIVAFVGAVAVKGVVVRLTTSTITNRVLTSLPF